MPDLKVSSRASAFIDEMTIFSVLERSSAVLRLIAQKLQTVGFAKILP
jgi:hypothetical protein